MFTLRPTFPWLLWHPSPSNCHSTLRLYKFSFLESTCKWYHTVVVFLRMTYLTQWCHPGLFVLWPVAEFPSSSSKLWISSRKNSIIFFLISISLVLFFHSTKLNLQYVIIIFPEAKFHFWGNKKNFLKVNTLLLLTSECYSMVMTIPKLQVRFPVPYPQPNYTS